MKLSVIILPGWGLARDKFVPLCTTLKTYGYRVYNPELPGFGKSAIPKLPLSLGDYALFLKRYINVHAIKNPVLVGHSFGGRVALKYLSDNPHGAMACILSGTPGFFTTSRLKMIKRTVIIAIAKMGNVFFKLAGSDGTKKAVRQWYYYMVGIRDFYKAKGPMKDTFRLVVKEDMLPLMKKVEIPTLLIWGEHDRLVPVSIARKMVKTIRKAGLVVIPKADHAVPMKEPAKFARVIHAFLSSV